MCTGKRPDPRWEPSFPPLKSCVRGAADEEREMPDMRASDGEEREDVVGGAEMEVQGLRGVGDRALRRHGGEARALPGMAHVQGLPGGHAGRRQDLQKGHGRVLVDMADARTRRRVELMRLMRLHCIGHSHESLRALR